jgi:hypothetical protein
MPKSSGDSHSSKKRTRTVRKEEPDAKPKRSVTLQKVFDEAEPQRIVHFPEAVGKVVKRVKYSEGLWGNFFLSVRFTDRTGLDFEFTAKMEMLAAYVKRKDGNVDFIKDYGKLSDDRR